MVKRKRMAEIKQYRDVVDEFCEFMKIPNTSSRTDNENSTKSSKIVEELFLIMANASYDLILRYLNLKKNYETMQEHKKKICSDNCILTARVLKLRENAAKSQLKIDKLTKALECAKDKYRQLKEQIEKTNMKCEQLRIDENQKWDSQRERLIDQKFTCTLCERSYRTAWKLKQHNTYIHENVKAQCHICSKFFRPTSLSRHLKIHK